MKKSFILSAIFIGASFLILRDARALVFVADEAATFPVEPSQGDREAALFSFDVSTILSRPCALIAATGCGGDWPNIIRP